MKRSCQCTGREDTDIKDESQVCFPRTMKAREALAHVRKLHWTLRCHFGAIRHALPRKLVSSDAFEAVNQGLASFYVDVVCRSANNKILLIPGYPLLLICITLSHQHCRFQPSVAFTFVLSTLTTYPYHIIKWAKSKICQTTLSNHRNTTMSHPPILRIPQIRLHTTHLLPLCTPTWPH